MKNIILSISILSLLMFSACEEVNTDILVGGDGSADLSGATFANIDPPTLVNFFFQGTTEISIDLNRVEDAGTTITSVDITKVLNIADLDDDPNTMDPMQSSPVTYTVSSDAFTQTLVELFADAAIDGSILTEDDLDPGDSWTLSYVINISGDGPAGSSILMSPTVTSIPFACISDISVEGTWLGVTQEGAFGVFSTNGGVTMTKLDDEGNYGMSDITGGFYTAFGFPENQPANFNDLCNFINIVSAPDANFNIVADPDEVGSWDSVTETLTVPWYDAGNDFEDLTVFTRE